MANVARVNGGNEQVLQPAVQENPLNRYVHLQPNAAEFEWWESAWNVAWWVLVIGYTLLAVGATIFIGITSPAQLPIATLTATLCLIPAGNYADGCVAEARKYARLAEIEHGIEDELDDLPDALNIPGIDVNIPDDLRPLAGRYLFWKNESERLQQSKDQFIDAAAREDASPQERLQNQVRAFKFFEEFLVARVHAVYFDFIIRNPHTQEDLSDFVHFHRHPIEVRLIQRALDGIFRADAEEQDPFLLNPDGTTLLTFNDVNRRTDEALRIAVCGR